MVKVKNKVTRVGSTVKITHETSGKTLWLDYEDYVRLGEVNLAVNEYYNGKYYVSVRGRYLHRLILNLSKPSDMVDHLNGNTLDNRKRNLRVCTNAQNQWNTQKRLNSNQKYKGVRKTKNNTYEARIRHLGKRLHLGTYKTIEEAVQVYNAKALELHGEFAYLNEL